MNKLSWFGCYDGSWQSAPLVAEAYAHPAKVSFNLAERIYRHMLAEGWLTPGAQFFGCGILDLCEYIISYQQPESTSDQVLTYLHLGQKRYCK